MSQSVQLPAATTVSSLCVTHIMQSQPGNSVSCFQWVSGWLPFPDSSITNIVWSLANILSSIVGPSNVILGLKHDMFWIELTWIDTYQSIDDWCPPPPPTGGAVLPHPRGLHPHQRSGGGGPSEGHGAACQEGGVWDGHDVWPAGLRQDHLGAEARPREPRQEVHRARHKQHHRQDEGECTSCQPLHCSDGLFFEKPWIWLDQIHGLEFYKVVLKSLEFNCG